MLNFVEGSEAEKAQPLAATVKVTDFQPEKGLEVMEPSVARRWVCWVGWE